MSCTKNPKKAFSAEPHNMERWQITTTLIGNGTRGAWSKRNVLRNIFQEANDFKMLNVNAINFAWARFIVFESEFIDLKFAVVVHILGNLVESLGCRKYQQVTTQLL